MRWPTLASWVVAIAALPLGIAVAGPRQAADPATGTLLRIADVQVTPLADGQHRVRVRSTGPQPFDLVRARGRKIVVRLYGARLGEIESPAKQAFGRVRLGQRGRDAVLRVKLRDGLTVRATQGSAAHVVDVLVLPEATR